MKKIERIGVMSKTWKVEVIVYHRFDVEADSYDEAREEANHVIWDDNIEDVRVELEERT